MSNAASGVTDAAVVDRLLLDAAHAAAGGASGEVKRTHSGGGGLTLAKRAALAEEVAGAFQNHVPNVLVELEKSMRGNHAADVVAREWYRTVSKGIVRVATAGEN